jgi:hypothetical protein
MYMTIYVYGIRKKFKTEGNNILIQENIYFMKYSEHLPLKRETQESNLGPHTHFFSFYQVECTT